MSGGTPGAAIFKGVLSFAVGVGTAFWLLLLLFLSPFWATFAASSTCSVSSFLLPALSVSVVSFSVVGGFGDGPRLVS